MKRRLLFLGLIYLAVILTPTTIGLALACIWTGDGRFGDTAWLSVCIALANGVVAGIWADEDGAPPKIRPRSERKALREAESRVHLDASIRALERELGQ